MTPYKKGNIVILDPILKQKKKLFSEDCAKIILSYGLVDLKYFQIQGKIINVQYVSKRKFMSYQVEFENKTRYWFAEKELLPITSTS